MAFFYFFFAAGAACRALDGSISDFRTVLAICLVVPLFYGGIVELRKLSERDRLKAVAGALAMLAVGFAGAGVILCQRDQVPAALGGFGLGVGCLVLAAITFRRLLQLDRGGSM